MTGGVHSEVGKFIAHEKLRPAQEKMVTDGINALDHQGFLLAAAPTGIGKTAASLAAALEIARSNINHQHILFLTGRQSQHKIVIETVKDINSRLDRWFKKNICNVPQSLIEKSIRKGNIKINNKKEEQKTYSD